MFIRLSDNHVENLCLISDKGRGFHYVNVSLKTGGTIHNAIVHKCELLEIPNETGLSSGDIKDIVVLSENTKTSGNDSKDTNMAEDKLKPDTEDSVESPEFDNNGNAEDDAVTFVEDEEPEMDEELPLIAGGGLLKILEHVIPLLAQLPEKASGSEIDNPFELLDDKDFDEEDDAVKEFKNDGGCKAIIRLVTVKPAGEAVDAIASIVDKLRSIRQANRQNVLVKTHDMLVEALNGGNKAKCQAMSVEAIDRLAADTQNTKEAFQLRKAREAILAGDNGSLDAAAFRLSQIKNSSQRTAFTSLNTQSGEGYIMAPEGVQVYGYPVPMEASKYREQSINARVDEQGNVSSQYTKWLTTADSQEAALGRLDTQRHPDNEANLLTLAKGERSKPLTKNERSWEQRLEDAKVHTFKEDKDDKSIETKLDDAKKVDWGHQGDPDEKSRPNEKFAGVGVDKVDAESDDTMGEQISVMHKEIGDEVIEEMLADSRKGLSDEDLDKVLDIFLEDQRTNDK